MCSGNDDDHPRNHAVIYDAEHSSWRLSPAFDVVPNPDDEPRTLCMQLSHGRFDISRDAVLAEAWHFGFDTRADAESHLDALLEKIHMAFQTLEVELSNDLRQLLSRRLARVGETLRRD